MVVSDRDEESTVAISKRELLYAMRYDCVAFLSVYLQEELTLAVPDFHEEMWGELLGFVEAANQPAVMRSLRKLFAVPREHAKSTLAKLAVILFLKYTPFAFCLYVSKTNSIAKNAIRDILIWLSGPQERELFGPIGIIKSSETESVWIFDMWVRGPGESEPRTKRCIFKALGADQQVRGLLILNRRPELIVIDDIEDRDNTKDASAQANLDAWFSGSLLKSFARNHFVLFIGNMLSKTTLLARLSKFPQWNPTVFGSLVRDTTTGELRALWQGRWTVETLLADYREYRALGQGHIWEAEMMNLTQDEVLGAELGSVRRIPAPTPEDIEAGVIVLDPAFGKNSWNDDSAITVHARIRGLAIPCVIDSWAGKATEEQLFDRMLEFSYQWGLTTWCIESVAAQKLLIPMFHLLFRTRLLSDSFILILPVLSGGNAKSARIIAFRRSVGAGSYGLAESQLDLLDLLAEYNPGRPPDHDDLVDSAAYGLIAWETYGELIVQRKIAQVAAGLMNRNDSRAGLRFGAAVSAF